MHQGNKKKKKEGDMIYHFTAKIPFHIVNFWVAIWLPKIQHSRFKSKEYSKEYYCGLHKYLVSNNVLIQKVIGI